MENDMKRTHGGARPGAGRPARFRDAKNISFRCAEPMASYLQTVANKSEYINECIEQRMRREGVWPSLAKVVRTRLVPFFRTPVACGSPISIEPQPRPDAMLKVKEDMCPLGECFVIKATGESMLGADIHPGDRLVIAANDLEPGEHQPTLFELDGEFTIKYLHRLADGRIQLWPDNEDFEPIDVGEEQTCVVRGTVFANLGGL